MGVGFGVLGFWGLGFRANFLGPGNAGFISSTAEPNGV